VVARVVLPETDLEKLRRFCEDRVPEHVRDKVRLEIITRGKHVQLNERRPPWTGRPGEWTTSKIAQLRYDGHDLWTLYFADRYDGWTLYFDLDPHQPVDVIINELTEDPTCVFWG
jgi:DUF3024 family protein